MFCLYAPTNVSDEAERSDYYLQVSKNSEVISETLKELCLFFWAILMLELVVMLMVCGKKGV